MKYIVILGDGMADEPLESLGGRTPLECAATPMVDELAGKGELGLAKTVLDAMKPGSDVANLAVLGYDAKKYYSGRSPLEAASIGIDLKSTDVTFRCNLVTLSDEDEYSDKTMIDYIRFICKEEAFGTIEEERAITDYIVYFTQEIGSIADSLRNPAAHANIIKCEKAEVCGNYIIKVKKILMHFLEKIDVSKLKELLKNNM